MSSERRRRLAEAGRSCLFQLIAAAALWLFALNPFHLRDLLTAAAFLSLGTLFMLHILIEAWAQVHSEWKPSAEANHSPTEWRPLPLSREGKETPSLMLRSFRAALIVSRVSIGGLFALAVLRLGGCLLPGGLR